MGEWRLLRLAYNHTGSFPRLPLATSRVSKTHFLGSQLVKGLKKQWDDSTSLHPKYQLST